MCIKLQRIVTFPLSRWHRIPGSLHYYVLLSWNMLYASLVNCGFLSYEVWLESFRNGHSGLLLSCPTSDLSVDVIMSSLNYCLTICAFLCISCVCHSIKVNESALCFQDVWLFLEQRINIKLLLKLKKTVTGSHKLWKKCTGVCIVAVSEWHKWCYEGRDVHDDFEGCDAVLQSKMYISANFLSTGYKAKSSLKNHDSPYISFIPCFALKLHFM
jgi:hypothetical protein